MRKQEISKKKHHIKEDTDLRDSVFRQFYRLSERYMHVTEPSKRYDKEWVKMEILLNNVFGRNNLPLEEER